MPGARLVNGKVILKDGFNISDATLEEKSAYVNKSYSNMMVSAVAVMGRMGMGPAANPTKAK